MDQKNIIHKCAIINLNMKNAIKLFSIIFLTLCLTSCVDYVQSISYSNGKYKMYYKVTLSKVPLIVLCQEGMYRTDRIVILK